MSKASARNPPEYNGNYASAPQEASSNIIKAIPDTASTSVSTSSSISFASRRQIYFPSLSQHPISASGPHRNQQHTGGNLLASASVFRSKTSPSSMSSFVGGYHPPDADSIPTYTICVIGDPRSGKSCFCNRFIYPHPDQYQETHSSFLSEVDFSGPVINSDPWLYWGTVTRQLDDENNVRFCVVEQTEFFNDATSRPYRYPNKISISAPPASVSTATSFLGSSSSFASSQSTSSPACSGNGGVNILSLPSSNPYYPDDYLLRSTAIKLYSPGKLRYQCTEQLGNEQHDQQEQLYNQGALDVHGFMVIYDVSRRVPPNSSSSSTTTNNNSGNSYTQLEFLGDILTLIAKRKKPVVIVATKRDAVDEQCLSTVINYMQKTADFRKMPVVEVSSRHNINVVLAFSTIARLVEGNSFRGRASKLKILSYQEATREQDEYQRSCREAFVNKISQSPAEFLTNWETFLSRYSHQRDVSRYLDLFGTGATKATFEGFTAQWKTKVKRLHMAKLPEALSTMLLYVGPVTDHATDDLLRKVRAHPHFDQLFISEESLEENLSASGSDISNQLQHHHRFQGCGGVGRTRKDDRIPFELALREAPNNGNSPFIESVKSLICAESWATKMASFEAALFRWQACGYVANATAATPDDFQWCPILPGYPMSDASLAQVDPECDLPREDQVEGYQKFQECLRLNAREDFLDLLLESMPHFICAATAYIKCLGDQFACSLAPRPPSSYDPSSYQRHQPRSEPNRSRPISPMNEQPSSVPLRSIQLPPMEARLCAALAPPRGVKEQQLGLINDLLATDSRYRALDYLPSERQTCLMSHFDLLSSRAEASFTGANTATIQRHNSCSSVSHPFQQIPSTTNMHQAPTFPMSYCPAYQTGRCADLVFANLCGEVVAAAVNTPSAFRAPNRFSSHLSCLLGQGEKCLSVAACSVCTDVVAAKATIGLFRAAGFSPESVVSPGLMSFVGGAATALMHSPQRPTQRLTSAWPLASALLSSAEVAASPIFGTVEVTFLSHHELLATLLNHCSSSSTTTRTASGPFDAVIIFCSTDNPIGFDTTSGPLCACCNGACSSTVTCLCCKCARNTTESSHSTTQRQRSLASRAAAIKALVACLSPVPHLLITTSTPELYSSFSPSSLSQKRFFSTPPSAAGTCCGSGGGGVTTDVSSTNASPRTPLARTTADVAFSFEGGVCGGDDLMEEEDDNTPLPVSRRRKLSSNATISTPLKIDEDQNNSHAGVTERGGCDVLDAISSFLSTCWSRKLQEATQQPHRDQLVTTRRDPPYPPGDTGSTNKKSTTILVEQTTNDKQSAASSSSSRCATSSYGPPGSTTASLYHQRLPHCYHHRHCHHHHHRQCCYHHKHHHNHRRHHLPRLQQKRCSKENSSEVIVATASQQLLRLPRPSSMTTGRRPCSFPRALDDNRQRITTFGGSGLLASSCGDVANDRVVGMANSSTVSYPRSLDGSFRFNGRRNWFEASPSNITPLSRTNDAETTPSDASKDPLFGPSQCRPKLLISPAIATADTTTKDFSYCAETSSPCSSAYSVSPIPSALRSPFIDFSEGPTPKLSEGVPPGTECHSIIGPYSRRRRGYRRHGGGADQQQDGEEQEEIEREEDFTKVDEREGLAGKGYLVQLMPCRHLSTLPTTTVGISSSTARQLSSSPPPPPAPLLASQPQLHLKQPGGQKSLDLSVDWHRVSAYHHHQQQQQPHSQSHSSVATATSSNHQGTPAAIQSNSGGSGSSSGGGVSFLASGLRSVVSGGFGWPRERRRSVSTPCGGGCDVEPSTLANNATNNNNNPPHTTATNNAFSGRTVNGESISTTIAPGYPRTAVATDTSSKASTPPFVDFGANAADPNLGDYFVVPRLDVSSLAHLARFVVTATAPPNTQPPLVHLHHWHAPSCPHRLCAPRQQIGAAGGSGRGTYGGSNPASTTNAPNSAPRHRSTPSALTTVRPSTPPTTSLSPIVRVAASSSNLDDFPPSSSFKTRHKVGNFPVMVGSAAPPALRHLPATPTSASAGGPEETGAAGPVYFFPSSSGLVSCGSVAGVRLPATSRSAVNLLSASGASAATETPLTLRLSPPPSIPAYHQQQSSTSPRSWFSSATKESASSNSTANAMSRRSKRNVLARFTSSVSGRHSTGITSTVAVSAPTSESHGECRAGGGASFPTTPVREAPPQPHLSASPATGGGQATALTSPTSFGDGSSVGAGHSIWKAKSAAPPAPR